MLTIPSTMTHSRHNDDMCIARSEPDVPCKTCVDLADGDEDKAAVEVEDNFESESESESRSDLGSLSSSPSPLGFVELDDVPLLAWTPDAESSVSPEG